MKLNYETVYEALEEINTHEGYMQVNYDASTGNVWTDYIYSTSTTEQYHDDNVYIIGAYTADYGKYEADDFVAELAFKIEEAIKSEKEH